MLAIAVLTAGLLRAVMENRAPARRAATAAEDSATLATSCSVAMNIAVMPFGDWKPFVNDIQEPPFPNCRSRYIIAAVACVFSRSARPAGIREIKAASR